MENNNIFEGVVCASLARKLQSVEDARRAKELTSESCSFQTKNIANYFHSKSIAKYFQTKSTTSRRKRRCLAQACSRPLPFFRKKDEEPLSDREQIENDRTSPVQEPSKLWFETDHVKEEHSVRMPDFVENALLPEERVEVLTVELVNEEFGGFRVVEGEGQCITMNEDVLHS